MVRALFNGDVHVHYGQVYVVSDEGSLPDFADVFAGQENGLCGAASPGVLFLTTGLHTGDVGFTVEWHDSPPAVDDTWEEVVEVSFTPTSMSVALVQWAGEAQWPLALGLLDYRVRYCAAGMTDARAADTRLAGQPRLDRYLLQFWPRPPEADRIVKQTSETAAYWHRVAREQPRRPSPAQQQAADDLKAESERQRRQLIEETLRWGGLPPEHPLRQAGGAGDLLLSLDRELVLTIAQADSEVQRAIARWTARRAYELAGLADLDWVAPALEALDLGQPLPPPFDDAAQLWRIVLGEKNVPRTTVTAIRGGDRNRSQQAMAVPALPGATHRDPLRAAVEALTSATSSVGDQYPSFFAELRRAFPYSAGRAQQMR